MKEIMIYEADAERIEEIGEKYNLNEWEIIELLLDEAE